MRASSQIITRFRRACRYRAPIQETCRTAVSDWNCSSPTPPARTASATLRSTRCATTIARRGLRPRTAAVPTPGADFPGGDEPVITAQPQSQSVVLGSNATFSVSVSGSAPFQYIWRFNGTNLPGATNSTLSLSAVQSNQAGAYSVYVF